MAGGRVSQSAKQEHLNRMLAVINYLHESVQFTAYLELTSRFVPPRVVVFMECLVVWARFEPG